MVTYIIYRRSEQAFAINRNVVEGQLLEEREEDKKTWVEQLERFMMCNLKVTNRLKKNGT